MDYVFSDKDRLSVKYYIQNDPTTNPFGAVGSLLGFPQKLEAGSQVVSIANTVIVSPNLTWEQHVGFTRLRAYAQDAAGFHPEPDRHQPVRRDDVPSDRDHALPIRRLANGLQFGPSTSFGDAGMFQNQWEAESTFNWVKGRHTIAFGGQWDHTQLNIINNNTNTDTLRIHDLPEFCGRHGANRRLRLRVRPAATTAPIPPGVFINDNFKLRSNLTRDRGRALGLRRTALGEVRPADGVQPQPIFVQCGHRHHHQFGSGNRGK